MATVYVVTPASCRWSYAACIIAPRQRRHGSWDDWDGLDPHGPGPNRASSTPGRRALPYS
jgi:hypothetical protein